MADICGQIAESVADCTDEQNSHLDSAPTPTLLNLLDENTPPHHDNDIEIDVLEQDIFNASPYLLDILLEDKTTQYYKNSKHRKSERHNILWACDEYAKYGEDYTAEKEIRASLIIGENTTIIQPRIAKLPKKTTAKI